MLVVDPLQSYLSEKQGGLQCSTQRHMMSIEDLFKNCAKTSFHECDKLTITTTLQIKTKSKKHTMTKK